MKIALVCAAAVALSLAACSGNSSSTSTSATPAASAEGAAMATSTPAGAPMGGNMHAAVVTIVMAPMNGSGESGTATLTAMGNKTRVNIGLKGENTTGDQPAHIHAGTCAKLNPAPKYPLKNVVLGKSNTVVDAPMSSLAGGKYAINVHESAKNIAKYVACGNIK